MNEFSKKEFSAKIKRLDIALCRVIDMHTSFIKYFLELNSELDDIAMQRP